MTKTKTFSNKTIRHKDHLNALLERFLPFCICPGLPSCLLGDGLAIDFLENLLGLISAGWSGTVSIGLLGPITEALL